MGRTMSPIGACLSLASSGIHSAQIKTAGELSGVYQCGMIERFGLPYHHTQERSYDKKFSIPLALIHWYDAPIEERAGWQPRYIQDTRSQPTRVNNLTAILIALWQQRMS